MAGGGAETLCGLGVVDGSLNWLTSLDALTAWRILEQKILNGGHGKTCPSLCSPRPPGREEPQCSWDQVDAGPCSWSCLALAGPVGSRLVWDTCLPGSSPQDTVALRHTARALDCSHSLALSTAHRCAGQEQLLAPRARAALDAGDPWTETLAPQAAVIWHCALARGRGNGDPAPQVLTERERGRQRGREATEFQFGNNMSALGKSPAALTNSLALHRPPEGPEPEPHS